jgi:hypothetical protein
MHAGECFQTRRSAEGPSRPRGHRWANRRLRRLTPQNGIRYIDPVVAGRGSGRLTSASSRRGPVSQVAVAADPVQRCRAHQSRIASKRATRWLGRPDRDSS